MTFTANLKVWTTGTKAQEIMSGASVVTGAVYVEYVSVKHTTDATSAVLTLTVNDGTYRATDKLVFHSFQSVVITIGGRDQDPVYVGDPNLGVFTIATNLYQQGYDVQMYNENQISKNGTGAAYDEVVRAVTYRHVNSLAICGYSWGGGATYDLAKGLQANTSIRGEYTLAYTAYIDGIDRHFSSIDRITWFSERKLPMGTEYHDNIYQRRGLLRRRDFLPQGDSVQGANNLNVTNTTWGQELDHLTIDNAWMVQSIIISNLPNHVVR